MENIQYIYLLIILLGHAGLLNKLEKICMRIIFGSNNYINRPLEKCKNLSDINISCLGMPSGHTEFITILTLLLNHYDLLSFPMVILAIFVIGIHRIGTKMHTLNQVIVGLLVGIMYANIYIKTNLSYVSLIILVGMIAFLTLIVTLYVNNIIQNDSTPDWVDKNLYSIIEKKKNISFHYKLGTTLLSAHYEDLPLYIDYKTLTKYLDKCIDKIQDSNINYDAIVGIKSGGAIVSNYIANKLNLKNYYVKITNKNYDCNSNQVKYDNDIIDLLLSNKKINKLCEGIDDNLENKNVVLIDEQIGTGLTMEFVVNYLLNKKKVNKLFVITITSKVGDIKFNNIDLNYIKKWNYAFVWPWGYDN